MPFLKLIQWATSKTGNPDWEESMAVDFLELCMELHPHKRLSASEALRHPFLSTAEEDEQLDDDVFLS
jgi:cell division control protein 7